MKRIEKMLKQLPVVKAPKSLDARIESLIDRVTATKSSWRGAWRIRFWVYAVSCMVFLIIGYSLPILTDHEERQRQESELSIADRYARTSAIPQAEDAPRNPFRTSWKDVRTWLNR